MHLKPHQIQTTDESLLPIIYALQDLIHSGDLELTKVGLDGLLTAIHNPYDSDADSLLNLEYQRGYRAGYSDTDWNPVEPSYDDGYQDGYNDAEREAENNTERAYQDGYEKGKAENNPTDAELWSSYYNGYNDANKKELPQPIKDLLAKAGFKQTRTSTYERDPFTISFTQNYRNYKLRSADKVVFNRVHQQPHQMELSLKADLKALRLR